MTPEPLLAPFTDKVKEVSFFFLGICSGTETRNRRSNPGPMGSSPATGANGTGHTVSVWPPEGICQKSCNHCAAQKIMCMVNGVQVSNWKQRIEATEKK